MIVRIMHEGQYLLDSKYLDDLNAIDNRIVERVGSGDAKGFGKELVKLVEFVRKKGKPIDPKEILESHIIIPPVDISLDEAKSFFRGEGLIKD